MWQASSRRLAPPPPAVDFLRPMRLPIGSTLISSNNPSNSLRSSSRTRSSRPGTPGASDNDLSSGRFMIPGKIAAQSPIHNFALPPDDLAIIVEGTEEMHGWDGAQGSGWDRVRSGGGAIIIASLFRGDGN